jgi:CRP-like cAMP-binding protein
MTGLSRRSRLEALIQGAWTCHIARLSCVSAGGGRASLWDEMAGGPQIHHLDRTALPNCVRGSRMWTGQPAGVEHAPGHLGRAQGRRQSGAGASSICCARMARERLRDNVVITLAVAPLTKLSSFVRRKTALPDLLGRRWSDGCDDLVGEVTASFLAASAAASWLVPALMFLLVIVVSLAGLRWIRSEHLEALRSVPLFSSLSKHQLMRILRAARAVEFQPNVEIIREGDAGKGLYTVTDGSAKVLVDGNQLATLGPGSYFGEMAVIDGGRRTATIVAATRVSTLELAPSVFLPILDSEPQLARALSAELCRRLHDTGGDSGDCGDDAPVDRARLVELCQRLRRTEHPDWTQGTSSRRRWLGLSSLFARGS